MLCHAIEGDVAQYREVTITPDQEAPNAKGTCEVSAGRQAACEVGSGCEASASHKGSCKAKCEVSANRQADCEVNREVSASRQATCKATFEAAYQEANCQARQNGLAVGPDTS